VRVVFLGVRGSVCSPGPDFVRYGGNTSCLALSTGVDTAPTLLLDAGTGIRTATSMLHGKPFRGTILVSHVHWDHVQGLPFFSAGDRAGAKAALLVPAQGGKSGRDLVAQMMSPPAFPITPEGLIGDWTFHAVQPGRVVVPDFEVRAFEVAHKGGRTFGYTVRQGGGSIGYVPDHAPELGVSADALEALEGVDVLVHDAQFLEHERPRAVDYGHATVDDAIRLAERVSAASLALFHHGPHRVDDALDVIGTEAQAKAPMPVLVAAEGAALDLEGQDPVAPPRSEVSTVLP
jgi:phosphoribosyl 1,2-cyclic phosphodiesterase